ncbi:MAG: OmpA family protein [Candidatus Omnitrophota bacterium]
MKIKRIFKIICIMNVFIIFSSFVYAYVIGEDKKVKRDEEINKLQERFKWWPTDALPAPVKDEGQGGYWWWPAQPGSKTNLWGNRGYIYVYKIIFDYNEDIPKEDNLRPSLVIKKIIKNVKIYFDFDKATLRDDHIPILSNAVLVLKRNPDADILITGNCDIRGSEKYNLKLGRQRADAVRAYMLDNGMPKERVKIISRGKLDAVAPLKDIVGMQKDRNAQFVIAEVDEFMLPKDQIPEGEVNQIEEGKVLIEEQQEVESEVKVSTREYTIRKTDTLWKIAEKELGNGNRWKYLYEFNKDRIKNPKKLKAGQVILIPVE